MSVARIALDAMGGDGPVEERVAAAGRVQREHDVEVVLVGDPAVLAATPVASGRTVAASQVVGMGEGAALSVRTRSDASIRVAMRLLAAGDVAAVVSAGSTGATVAAALLEVGRLPGVRRPVLAAVLPVPLRERNVRGVVLVDVGANPAARAPALVASARLGRAYARVRGIPAPRVALLNVGSEAGKGNALARSAYLLLTALPGFVGNVEPADVLAGTADVVVTDGFTGNVFLKTLEAVAPRTERPGAALLLGVPRPVLVAHGAARSDELARALEDAAAIASSGVVARLPQALADAAPRA